MATAQTWRKGKKNDQQRQGGAESSDYNVETRAERCSVNWFLNSLPGGANHALLCLG